MSRTNFRLRANFTLLRYILYFYDDYTMTTLSFQTFPLSRPLARSPFVHPCPPPPSPGRHTGRISYVSTDSVLDSINRLFSASTSNLALARRLRCVVAGARVSSTAVIASRTSNRPATSRPSPTDPTATKATNGTPRAMNLVPAFRDMTSGVVGRRWASSDERPTKCERRETNRVRAREDVGRRRRRRR